MEEGEIIEVGGTPVKFCGDRNWLETTTISCNKRVAFLVDTYHISPRDAKISLLEDGNCICSGGSEIQTQTKPSTVLPPITEEIFATLLNETNDMKQYYANAETQFTGNFVTISLSLFATLAMMTCCSRKGHLFIFYALGFVILLYQSLLLQYMPHQSNFDDLSLPLNANAHIDNNSIVTPMKVWHYDTNVVGLYQRSSTLVQTMDKDEEAVSWVFHLSAMPKIAPIAAERLEKLIRLEKHSQHNSGNNQQQLRNVIRTNMTGYLHNVTQDELNNVNPEWKLFIFDASDRGVGPWGLWYMETELAKTVGWKRIHYITRTTQKDRNMDSWVTQSKENSHVAADFGAFAGVPTNFTEYLGKACASVQRSTYAVRDDINDAIDDYMRSVAVNMTNSLSISPAVANLHRPTDVRTFWNGTVCLKRSERCEFRNYIAEEIASLPSKHPGMKVNTDVIGFIHKKGRKNVSPDYIEAMLTTKIIVLAQRDKWEGHLRLMEGFLSGALVLSDPQIYYPFGVVDGVNIVVYHSMIDLEEKILYFLDPMNEQERIMIGQRGREIALSENRHWDNMERLLLNDDNKYVNDYGVSYLRWKGHGNP